MAEYVNNHFDSYIPDKEIEGQLLTENPVSSNLQQLKHLNSFIRLSLPSQTGTTLDHQMEWFQGETLEAMVLYPIYGKG